MRRCRCSRARLFRVAHASRVIWGAQAPSLLWPAACRTQRFPEIAEPQYHHRRLPHFERPHAKYAITFSTTNPPYPFRKGPGRRNGLNSSLGWQALRAFRGCVMPDHVHLLMEPMVERQNESGNSIFFSLSKILHSIKSFTANRINKIEKVNEPVWESESLTE